MNIFDIVRLWHKMFALHIEFLIDGVEQSKLDPQTVGDDAKCDLGKWLSGAGWRLSTFPEHADLIAKHRQLHRTASSILKEHSAGHLSSALQIYTRSFLAESDAVLAAIDALASCAVRNPQQLDLAAGSQEIVNPGKSNWRESMRIGMDLLDQQHIELAELIELLNNEPEGSTTAPHFVVKMAAVEKLTVLHFDTEEIFMQRVEYPHHLFMEHVKEHERLLGVLLRMEIQAASGEMKTAKEVYQPINDEIINHILTFDVLLNDYAVNQ